MSYTTPITFVALGILTAAQLNTIQANISAIWAGTAAGDMDYYSSPTSKGRLAKPSVSSVYTMDSSGTPVWTPRTSVGSFHTSGTADVDLGAPGQSFAGDSAWHDITGATINITTSLTCTIVVLGIVTASVNTAGNSITVRSAEGATADTGAALPYTSNPYAVPFGYSRIKPSVSAGTYTFKLQAMANGNGGNVSRARIIVIAVAE